MLLIDVWIDAPHRHRRLTLLRLVDPEGRTLPYRLMSEALGAGTLRIGEEDERGAAQSQVWEGVADFSRRTGVRSDTGALDDLYGARQDEIEKGAHGVPLRAGQVGTLAAVGDRVVGMDLVGCVELYARLHRGLVRGYLFEALADEGPGPGMCATASGWCTCRRFRRGGDFSDRAMFARRPRFHALVCLLDGLGRFHRGAI